MGKVFVGIDPGVNKSEPGALGILDSQGGFLGSWRWNHRDPLYLYNKLLLFKELIGGVYLEMVRVFPKEEKGFITQNQSLLVNSGIWQGWLITLGLSYLQIDPNTWQAAQKLLSWRKRHEKDPRQHTPLTLARVRWPAAPLEFKADGGKAVALLLADLALKDHREGVDRSVIQQAAAEKKKKKQQSQRAARKAGKAFMCP